MALQFIIGGSGTGKSYTAYEKMIREAESRPDVLFYIIVPEQFTLQTQKTVVSMSGRGGILNIDVVSLTRLAYRVFEETGGDTLKMLDDIGKSMMLRSLVQGREKEYPYLGSQIKKAGCLDEVKSLISEFMQYDISPEETLRMAERAGEKSLLSMKLADVGHLYENFLACLKDRYMTSEGIMEELAGAIPLSRRLKGCVVLLDGFTGFTPVQLKVLRELLAVCRDMMVTVTMEAEEIPAGRRTSGSGGKTEKNRAQDGWSLFSMSRKMIWQLSQLSGEVSEPILLCHNESSRFCHSPSLAFLEKNLFRYSGRKFPGIPDSIRVVRAKNPQAEMEEAGRRICRMVREEGLRYGEIAVVTGNLEEYAPQARQVFERAGIPFFIDETHSIMLNPFVEYLRAALELIESNFSYESVFLYLRCGLSELTREETDLLENYVRASGIAGASSWEKKWIRLSRGMDPAEIGTLNELRERFLEETKELREGLSGNRTVREYCTRLYYFLRKNRIQEKLLGMQNRFAEAGERVLEKEYAQIYGIVLELFDRMTEILGEEKMTPGEFGNVLETGLSKAKVALIPPGQDQVLVGDMERTRLKNVKVLIFAGVNEGNIPRAASSGGILSEPDRDYLAGEGIELAPDPREQMNIQRFYLYLNLTKPASSLILSYSSTSQKGESLRPAYLIATLKNMYPALAAAEAETGIPESPVSSSRRAFREEDGTFLPELLPERPEPALDLLTGCLPGKAGEESSPLFSELYRWYQRQEAWRGKAERIVEAAFSRSPSGTIGSAAAKALYGEIPENGATRLERFAQCACAHFLRYGLRLMERQEYEFREADLGRVVHGVLEALDGEMKKEELSLRSLTEEDRGKLVDRCLDFIAADYGNTVLLSSSRNLWMVERARKILKRTLWALQQQLLSGRFDPEGVEIAFGGGRIDRMDIMIEENRVYVKVIDYKTGNTAFDLLKLFNGLQLQLVLYLDAAMQIEKKRHPGKEVIPAGIFYYNVKDPMQEGSLSSGQEEVNSQILKALRMDGLSSGDPEIIRAMDGGGFALPVRLSAKTGELDQKTKAHAASREQFGILAGFVRKMTKENSSRILEGEVGANPYRLKQGTPCDYCAYKTACGFDPAIPGYSFRELPGRTTAEVWNLMEERVRETSDAGAAEGTREADGENGTGGEER